MGEKVERKRLSSEAAGKICGRLCLLDDLYFPNAISRQDGPIDPTQRRDILLDLLSSDAAVFLERYGLRLNNEELAEFECLRGDYEVNWHLKQLRSAISPTLEEKHLRSVTVKNRRRAFLDKLIHDGQYFSEDAMREREPYLHHEYVGKFQDPVGRGMSRPGERWSETLMRRAEENIITAEIRKEQERLGVPKKDWVGPKEEEEVEEEEEEEEEESDEEMEVDKGRVASASVKVDEEACNSSASAGEEHLEEEISAVEMQDRMDQFTRIMQQKLLSGEDTHLDYTKIDDDVTLDDHWMKEVTYDAEEKYFAED
ncbi:uncharacterized protein LOC116252244 isoform X2 [Nymphaea colorata]|uniref:uncharacterized protein LOC116252244 isoform X2 n=1 Tax=Nymphaea colorata TaxID=210225 RepID=UPI00129E8E96|nr:uncharacterized protein LOC116252244 isoform X2 [Nymphaea colorata]